MVWIQHTLDAILNAIYSDGIQEIKNNLQSTLTKNIDEL